MQIGNFVYPIKAYFTQEAYNIKRKKLSSFVISSLTLEIKYYFIHERPWYYSYFLGLSNLRI